MPDPTKKGSTGFHVIVVGRAKGTDSGVLALGPCDKRTAYQRGEAEYRRSAGLASNIALTSKVVFTSDSEDEARAFFDLLTKTIATAEEDPRVDT